MNESRNEHGLGRHIQNSTLEQIIYIFKNMVDDDGVSKRDFHQKKIPSSVKHR